MTNKQLSRVNSLLGQELGRNERGEPRYQWRQSKTLLHHMRAHGYDYKADPESGLIKVFPRYEERLLCEELEGNQWVMVMWQEPMPQDQWLMMFGELLEWPRSGTYIPCTSSNGYVCLDPGFEPNERITWAFIDEIKQQLNKRYVDHLAAQEMILEKRERETDRILTDRIDDLVGPYMSVPGKRGYHVSFPDPKHQNANT